MREDAGQHPVDDETARPAHDGAQARQAAVARMLANPRRVRRA